MKKFFLSLIVSAAVLAGCDFFVDPVAYNDKLVAIDEKSVNAYDTYVKEANNTPLEGKLDELDKKRQQTIETIKAAKKELEAMEGLKGDTALRDAFIVSADELVSILENEEKQLVELWKKMSQSDGPTDEDLKKEQEITKAIEDKMDASYKKGSKAQEDFATKHGYDLEPEKK